MSKYRNTVSIITFALFIISAVTGLTIFFMPHGPRPDAAHKAVEAISFGLVLKRTHEYGSVLMAMITLFHIYLNWGALKSYMFKRK
ncbi:MAG: DUF4405 domain-containing protein [Deferribacterales bacterium]